MSVPSPFVRLPDIDKIQPWRSAVGADGERGAFWESERQRLLEMVGDLSGVTVQMNRILIAVWERPQRTGGGIIRPTTNFQEDRHQGVAGLVLAYGPTAYVSDDQVQFADGDKPPLHSWIVFRKGDGFRLPIRAAQCVVLEGEKGIKAVIPRPDIVTEG
ncbi:MAG TPA: hypothetical protein VNH17_03905 [Streptosporangiaceae bacterium]|nr:hypothetical protein [Streptosporangiaceae bacterium]